MMIERRRRRRSRPVHRPLRPEAVPFLAQAETDVREALAKFSVTRTADWYMKLMIDARAEELARQQREVTQ